MGADETWAGWPSERDLHAAWAALRGRAAQLTTAEGERVRVLFPGLPNAGPGPDFRAALLATERGRLVRGDVELHLSAAGWRAHRHDTDPRYRSVVLHVVGEGGGAPVTPLPGRGRVPVVRLPPLAPPAGAPAHPCGGCRPAVPDAAQVLARLGLERLEARARAWRRSLARGADGAVATALVGLLGGPRNRAPMAALAAHLAPEWAQAPATLEDGQALLLGLAGLLEGRPPPLPPELLDRLRARWEALGGGPPLGLLWDRAGQRPAAHPARRLLGVAVWWQRWAAAGGPVRWVLGYPPVALAHSLAVTSAQAGLQGPAPIGAERAAALAVNVGHPVQLAAAWERANAAAAEAVQRAYLAAPPLEPDAVVRPLAGALGLAGHLGAAQQQGLHHLHRRWCSRGRQGRCPLSGLG